MSLIDVVGEKVKNSWSDFGGKAMANKLEIV